MSSAPNPAVDRIASRSDQGWTSPPRVLHEVIDHVDGDLVRTEPIHPEARRRAIAWVPASIACLSSAMATEMSPACSGLAAWYAARIPGTPRSASVTHSRPLTGASANWATRMITTWIVSAEAVLDNGMRTR